MLCFIVIDELQKNKLKIGKNITIHLVHFVKKNLIIAILLQYFKRINVSMMIFNKNFHKYIFIKKSV